MQKWTLRLKEGGRFTQCYMEIRRQDRDWGKVCGPKAGTPLMLFPDFQPSVVWILRPITGVFPAGMGLSRPETEL